MHKRLLIALTLGAALSFGAAGISNASGADPAPAPPAASAPGPDGKKGGNGFARALKAPFKAIGRLFGKGGGKEENKLERLSEKDVEKFESARFTRVKDATTPAAPAAAASASAESPAAELVSLGRAALGRGALNEAVTLLTRAASVDPKLAEAHRLAGQAYARMGLHDQSSRAFRRAVDLTPKDAQTLNDYGYALYLAGDLEGAIKYLKRSAKYNPQSQRVWNNLAVAQCRAEKFDDAYKSFARAVGEFAAHVNVAKMLVRAGRDDQAIKHYEQARRVGPPTPDLLRSLVALYDRTGRPADAEETRRQMVTADKGPAPSNGN